MTIVMKQKKDVIVIMKSFCVKIERIQPCAHSNAKRQKLKRYYKHDALVKMKMEFCLVFILV